MERKNKKKLEHLTLQGFVEQEGSIVKLTKKGMDLANAIIVELI